MKFKGALAVKNMLQFIAVRVLNDLNHQPIFTHKDCSYICVIVVLNITNLQTNHCVFCISLHLKMQILELDLVLIVV